MVANSTLPGLAPGWEQIAHFRFEAIVEKKHEFRKEGYFQWVEEDKELSGAVQPFTREEAMDFQQIAIANCLGWIVDGVMGGVYGSSCHFSHDDPTPAQYLFANALVRMSETGQPWHDDHSHAYQGSKSKLEGFILRRSGTSNPQVTFAKREYHRYVSGLGNARCATQ